jgi:formylglycine-generating enzyme required for sulfatase activity
VGTKQWNELTIYDMSGNVWEWVWDTDGAFPSTDQTDPTGAETGFYNVLRSGAWDQTAWMCQVYYHIRNIQGPTAAFAQGGFRIVRKCP